MPELSSPVTILETPRLLLRSLTPELYTELFTTGTPEQAAAILGESWQQEGARFRNGLTTFNRSFLNFQLITKEDQQLIGACGYHTWYLMHDRAEIGYALNGDGHHGKGYMKEALAEVIRYGFEDMRLNRIEAMVAAENEASLRLLKGIGFEYEGLLREHYVVNGKAENSLVFGLLKKDYQQAKNNSLHA